MEPHRPPSSKRAPRPAAQRSERATRPVETHRDASPLGPEWLEREALRYVARWETSRHGVSEVLLRKLEKRCARTGEDPASLRAHIPQIVDHLTERDYVNDQRFAEHLILRLRRQGQSSAQIRARLRAKGVEPASLDEIEARRSRRSAEAAPDRSHDVEGPVEDSEIDEELEAAWQTARKRRLGPFTPDPLRRAADRHRHLAVLARRGFSSDTAHAVIDGEIDPETETRGRDPQGRRG